MTAKTAETKATVLSRSSHADSFALRLNGKGESVEVPDHAKLRLSERYHNKQQTNNITHTHIQGASRLNRGMLRLIMRS